MVEQVSRLFMILSGVHKIIPGLEKAEADSLFLGNCETLEPIFLEHE
jgi:hypothetical protein